MTIDKNFAWIKWIENKSMLLHLNQVLCYALFLSYHSNADAVLFACLLSSWATTTGRLLGPKIRNSIKCLSQVHSNALPHRVSNQSFTTFRLLARRPLPTTPSPQKHRTSSPQKLQSLPTTPIQSLLTTPSPQKHRQLRRRHKSIERRKRTCYLLIYCQRTC